MSEITVVFPVGAWGASEADDALDAFLRELAVVARLKYGEARSEYGEWAEKYGTNVDNETFLMRPYCWCEKEGECPWCTGCSCPEGSYQHYVDETPVTYAEWAAFFEREVGPHEGVNHDAWIKRAEAANRRRDYRQVRTVCDYCTGQGIFAKFTPRANDDARRYDDPPNFWYRPIDFRVTWYKYIGRDVCTNRDISAAEFDEMRRACIAAVSVK